MKSWIMWKNSEEFRGCVRFWLAASEHQLPFRKEREQMERLAFVAGHRSCVCPKAHRSHRLELFRNPGRELDIGNIYGQFIIDASI